MSVNWRKDSNSYVIKIYLGKINGKKKYKTIATRTDNLEHAKAMEASLLAAKKSVKSVEQVNQWTEVIKDIAGIDEERKSLALSLLVDEWAKCDGAIGLADTTYRNRMKSLKKFLRWMEAEMPQVLEIHLITVAVGYKYRNWLREQGISSNSINNDIGHLRGVWRGVAFTANVENIWQRVESVPALMRSKNSFERRSLSAEEVEMVLDRARDAGVEWEGAILFGVYTGLRLGDIVRLPFECIEDNILMWVPGKTAKSKVRVCIPLHQTLIDYLEGLNKAEFLIFPDLAAKYGSGAMQRKFKHIFGAVEDDRYKISFHCLRHTFRTWISRAGASLEQSKRLCGHLTDAMSLRYNHEVELLKDIIDGI